MFFRLSEGLVDRPFFISDVSFPLDDLSSAILTAAWPSSPSDAPCPSSSTNYTERRSRDRQCLNDHRIPRGFPKLCLREGTVSSLIPIPYDLHEISIASISAVAVSSSKERVWSSSIWSDPLSRIWRIKSENTEIQQKWSRENEKLVLDCLADDNYGRRISKSLEFCRPIESQNAIRLFLHQTPTSLNRMAENPPAVSSILANFVLSPSGDSTLPLGPSQLLSRLKKVAALFSQIRSVKNDNDAGTIARLEPSVISDVLLNWWKNHAGVEFTQTDVQELMLFLIDSSICTVDPLTQFQPTLLLVATLLAERYWQTGDACPIDSPLEKALRRSLNEAVGLFDLLDCDISMCCRF